MFGFTFLNPHVYLDTFLLIGSVSTQYEGQKLAFTSGAVSASIVFFFALGYGASALAPLFRQPRAWRILDLLVGLIMAYIAVDLLR